MYIIVKTLSWKKTSSAFSLAGLWNIDKLAGREMPITFSYIYITQRTTPMYIVGVAKLTEHWRCLQVQEPGTCTGRHRCLGKFSMQQIYILYLFHPFETKMITQFLSEKWIKCKISTYRPPTMGFFTVFLSPTRVMPGYYLN
jgi:hypothetical protein